MLSILSSILTPVIHPCLGPSDTQPRCPGNARLDLLVLVLVAEVTQLMWTSVSLLTSAFDRWGA